MVTVFGWLFSIESICRANETAEINILLVFIIDIGVGESI